MCLVKLNCIIWSVPDETGHITTKNRANNAVEVEISKYGPEKWVEPKKYRGTVRVYENRDIQGVGATNHV